MFDFVSEKKRHFSNINSKAKQALYDNLDNDEELSLVLDEAIRYKKLDGFRDGGIKEKKLRIEVNKIIKDPKKTMELMDIIKLFSIQLSRKKSKI